MLGYDVGYLALAHPEARAYARRELVAFARDFGADGVQLEFLPVLAAGERVWPLGYRRAGACRVPPAIWRRSSFAARG